MDGSVIVSNSAAACARIVRSHLARFIATWSVNLGYCSITLVEIWGAYWDIYIGIMLDFRNIVLELDSICVYQYISQGVKETHMYAPIINAARKLMEDANNNIVIRHVYREANACADGLAKHGYIIFFDSLPPCISLNFLANSIGHVRPCS